MKIDNATLEVLAHHCAAAAEAMGYTLMRTAYSTFVKETEDFSCQIMTPDGHTFASPKSLGATWYTGLDYGPVLKRFDYQEGDICMTNDPYSGFVATHAPDIHIWKPVFREGRLICFVGCHIHNTDIGGAVPASLSRTLTEVHQEGIRIPPLRLVRDGKIDERVLEIMAINVRVPDQNWGDLNAQFACVNIGERKVHEIIDRFGLENFEAGMYQLLDYAERQARRLLAQIPDGDYAFADYADEDSVGGYPARIALTMRKIGDGAVLDFTGTDPQLVSSLNMPTGGNPRHALITVGYIYSMYTLDPTITLNAGTARPVTAILPKGTVVNCEPPAAVGMRSLLSNVTQTVFIGAFSQAVPDRIPASPGSGLSIMNVKTSTRDGRTVMASIGPVGGGAGGGPSDDGAEGSGANMSFLKNSPVEINEAEIPLRIRKYGLVANSGGSGRWRGGSALMMEFEVFAPQSMVTARNRDRSIISAWGVLGGGPGAVSEFVKNPGGPSAVVLGNSDIVHCDPGDVIRITGPGAGGYGNPLDRPVESVLADVRSGFVTASKAMADYGVVIDEASNQADVTATTKLRKAMAAAAKPGGHFRHGVGRIRHEAVWTLARYDALTKILAAVPTNWRFFVKHRLFAAMKDKVAGADGGAADLYAAYGLLCERFRDLPAVTPTGGAAAAASKAKPKLKTRAARV